MREKCDNTEIAFRGAQHLVALDKVTTDCGLDDITIKVSDAILNVYVYAADVGIVRYCLKVLVSRSTHSICLASAAPAGLASDIHKLLDTMAS